MNEFKPGLEWLLWPTSIVDFIDTIWTRKFHHFKRHDPQFYNALCTAAEIEDYLDVARVPISSVRLISVVDEIARNKFRFDDGELDLVAIRNAFSSGYSIVLNTLDRYITKMAVFSHAIEIDLNFECQVNAYLTPPSAQAFPAHFDDHDVIVAQLQGSKIWSIYEDTLVPSTRYAAREDVDASTLPPPTAITLEAGDALYIPRGMVHAAQAAESSSVHLTFGIHSSTVKSLIVESLNALSLQDERLNERLPPRLFDDLAARTKALDLVRTVATMLAQEDAVADGIGSLQDNLVRRGRCHAQGALVSNAVDVHHIDGLTKLVRYSPIYSRVMAMADGVALQFGQSLVTASVGHLQAMQFVSKASGKFSVGDLPGLEPAEQVEFARQLVINGFLISSTSKLD